MRCFQEMKKKKQAARHKNGSLFRKKSTIKFI